MSVPDIEARERISRLEEWRDHTDRKIERMATVLERMTWLLVALAALMFGQEVFPLLKGFINGW